MRTNEEWIESVTVLFDDDTCEGDQESRKALVELLRKVRGVAAVVPSKEVGRGHLEWREIVEALGIDTCEENAQEMAVRDAAAACAQLERAIKMLDAWFKVATPEQQQEFAPLLLQEPWRSEWLRASQEDRELRASAIAKLTAEERRVLGV